MMRGKLIKVAMILALATGIRWDGKVAGQTQTPPAMVPSFKSSVDMVRIAAIVRDRKGRFVADLTARDFEILDGGQARNIKDFRHDLTGVSVAMLFDVSGSMEGHLKYAREAAEHVMSWLDPDARRGGGLHVRHASGRGRTVHGRLEDAASGMTRSKCRSARRRCTTPSR